MKPNNGKDLKLAVISAFRGDSVPLLEIFRYKKKAAFNYTDEYIGPFPSLGIKRE